MFDRLSVRRQKGSECEVERLSGRPIFSLFAPVKMPNKAPEPTSTSVTLRAIASSSEMNLRTEVRALARSAPAVAVAHL